MVLQSELTLSINMGGTTELITFRPYLGVEGFFNFVGAIFFIIKVFIVKAEIIISDEEEEKCMI